MLDHIFVKGARENNLKNIDVDIPRDKLVVLTGLSGSGKSSLAFDTIYAEGQRRYVESLSSYARMFLGQMEKPDVDYIDGLSPAISIDQKTTSKNPRSTVGTVTEIYDYLRLLWARVGTPHCPICGKEIRQQTIDQIIDQVMALPEATRIQVLAPVVRGKKGTHQKLLEDARKSGYVRCRADGSLYDLSETIELDKNKKHNVEIVVDRLVIREDIVRRLTDSVEVASSLAGGLVVINIVNEDRDILFSQNYACEDCGISIEELSPRMFSFNNPFGACPTCTGLGSQLKVDPALIIPNPSLSILDGAITASGWNNIKGDSISRMYFEALAKKYGFKLTTPVKDLPEEILDIILYGTRGEKLKLTYDRANGHGTLMQPFEGIANNLERRYKETQSDSMRRELEECMSERPCPDCGGKRLRREALAVTVGGINIDDFCRKPVTEALAFIDRLELSEQKMRIADRILKEIKNRLGFLQSVGLQYLTLSRAAATLSGGESQRIRLPDRQQPHGGALYPGRALHRPAPAGQRQAAGHPQAPAGPGQHPAGGGARRGHHAGSRLYRGHRPRRRGPRGRSGGLRHRRGDHEHPRLHHRGLPFGAEKDPRAGRAAEGQRQLPHHPGGGGEQPPGHRRVHPPGHLHLRHRRVRLRQVLPGQRDPLQGPGRPPEPGQDPAGEVQGHRGEEFLDKVIDIDQSPIGRTPRSNPATYTGLFNDIRDLFASTPDAKARGYGPGRFSFNVRGGRCEACQGDGLIKIEMHFLPDIYVPCEVCKGKRYNRETLEVRYKGKNIYEVLEMTVEEALPFFENLPRLYNKLQTLYEVGLGYVKLGQPSTELSGGEAQRVKLATELAKRSTGQTIYILDEPTTGLHSADVHKLIEVLQKLVDVGNTVVVIEHNLDVIKTADYLIDLGPEGGDGGGSVVATGTPEQVARCAASYTGQYLKRMLE